MVDLIWADINEHIFVAEVKQVDVWYYRSNTNTWVLDFSPSKEQVVNNSQKNKSTRQYGEPSLNYYLLTKFV